MSIWELILLAVGLSMDAFAVAVCKGLAMQKVTAKGVLTVGGWFGGFQALMPCIGYFLMAAFQKYITAFDHWIAFVLLGIIGANMIKEAFCQEECADASLSVRVMFTMAVATSIDALAAGATLIVLSSLWEVLFAVAAIGVITFTLSAVGVKVGNVFGSRWRVGASVAGGVILILLGVKILLEHLGILVL
ncbi:MAG: manganese efflux pump [Clostridia bacterium]|nr:manganese efflux pump [Clostridia bacterium]